MEHVIYRIASAEGGHDAASHGESHDAHGAAHGEAGHGEVVIVPVKPAQVDTQMIIWTWVVFAVVAVILYRIAWKPILAGLAQREEKIQRALDDARTAREQVEQIEATRGQLIAEADAKAKEILAEARAGAVETAAVIEKKAREEAQILLENAQREVRTAREQAEASLRQEMADFAVAISSKLVRDNMDTPKNQALVSKLVQEL